MLEWGRDKNAADCVTVGEKVYSLKTAGQLYDLLMLLNSKNDWNNCPVCGQKMKFKEV